MLSGIWHHVKYVAKYNLYHDIHQTYKLLHYYHHDRKHTTKHIIMTKEYQVIFLIGSKTVEINYMIN